MEEHDQDEIYHRVSSQHICPLQNPGSVAIQAPKSEGASTTDSMMCLERDPGGGVRRTSLTKREC